jgi:type IV secretion system protein VirB10
MQRNRMLARDPLLTGRDRDDQGDPRQSAEIIDLATRNVLPQVARGRPRSDAMGLVAGIAIVAALGGVTLWSMNTARETRQAVAPPVAAPPLAALPPQAITPIAPRPAPIAAPAPQPVLAAPPQTAVLPQPAANRYATPTIVFDGNALPQAVTAPAGPPVPVAGPAPALGGNDDFAARLGGVGGGPATAAVTIDPQTTVTQGTLIPAILETAIDTDVPGFVRAVVSADVRSFDGSRVLVPRSSRLVGQYKSGLQAGQKRAYVIWTRLIRPDGVSVAIASPAVGFAGETGIAGKVNSHFFQRFGSAILLSVIGGLTAPSGVGGLIVAGSGQSAASTAIDQSGKIGPTVRVRQGEPIRVFTARDLDFSKVPAA